MTNDKSIQISLGDEKAKDVAEVLGNKTCNKILDYLVENEGTVSEISDKLNIPLNTVDYNIKKLVKAGLIESSSHFWSVKGKKMPAYKISNKKIIISPKSSLNKAFLWVLGITGLVALTVRQFFTTTINYAYNQTTLKEVGVSEGARLMTDSNLQEESIAMVSDHAVEGAVIANETVNGIMNETITTSTNLIEVSFTTSPWTWFLIGAWFAVLLFFIVNYINVKK